MKDADDDFSNAAYETTSSLWIYLYRCAKLGARSLWKKKKNVVLEEQIRALCDKVIQHRLTKMQLGDTILARKTNLPIRQDVVHCICTMTDVIVATNPKLYKDVALKLNITFHEERLVCKAYSDFAEILFSNGPTWPLLISLLAFSGSLAVECTRKGRSILVRRISDWATIFIVMRLRDWIIQQGKWDGVLRYFEPKKQSPSLIPDAFVDDLLSKYRKHEKSIQQISFGLLAALCFYILYSMGSVFYDIVGGKNTI